MKKKVEKTIRDKEHHMKKKKKKKEETYKRNERGWGIKGEKRVTERDGRTIGLMKAKLF